jgi:hypothetical protein
LKQQNFAGALFGLGFLLALAGRSEAQSHGTFRAMPEPANSRRGVATAPRQPTVVVVPSSSVVNPVFPRQPIAFTWIPAILMSDGTVMADFGMGYEQVTRSCNNTVVVQSQQSTVFSSEPRVVAGNGVVLSPGPTYTQPVPNQPTASQLNLPSAQSRFPVLTSASQASCFSRDPGGRIFVVRQ